MEEPKQSNKTLAERVALLEHNMAVLYELCKRVEIAMRGHQASIEAIAGLLGIVQPAPEVVQKRERAKLN